MSGTANPPVDSTAALAAFKAPAETEELEHDDSVREHFIPLRKTECLRLCLEANSLTETQSHQLSEFSRLIEAIFHFEHHATLERIKTYYAAFDPDADTIEIGDDRRDDGEKLFEEIGRLLKGANYHRLNQQQIDAALDAATDWGLNLQVDFSIFARLEFWVRGRDLDQRELRSWKTRFKKVEVQVPVYRRLVLIFQLGDDDAALEEGQVVFKSFKNIPREDIEMLLPGTRVKMSWLDQGKIWVPSIGGIAFTLFKIFKAALLSVALTVTSLFTFLGLLAGGIGYGVKSFMGYLSTKDKYKSEVTKKLYYQNLGNNAGVFFRLLDESEEQEYREALFAYYFLWQEAPPQGWTEKELDDAIEAFLLKHMKLNIDFECDDAIAKLERMKLLRVNDKQLTAVPIETALQTLDETWDNYFQYHNTE